ncbi:hypothetical protein SDC9_141009 [bioreactor metagenome]|uniref:Uncharacterized protein n=1 Tax=bioreactor metagenome TaxID=1076179 RepID=A0A645DWW5_9ZZZZ
MLMDDMFTLFVDVRGGYDDGINYFNEFIKLEILSNAHIFTSNKDTK